ncbi:hypothetical protein ACH5RR_018123 [Cinchona calisaya]|uniref:Uncharacterized protein n=1 Tax=Cinchona calisaya TaxID=153742 RepID=A0ABD2ZKI4_9GENT
METGREISLGEEADRERAYSAVISLKEILEYLLQLLSMILEIKKMQAEAFEERAGRVLKLLQETSDVSESNLRQSTRETGRLALTMRDFVMVLIKSDNTMVLDIMDIMKSIYASSNIDHKKPQMMEKLQVILEQVPQTLQEINLIDELMKRFLNDTDLDKILEDLYHYVEVQPSREMVKDLLQASGKLKQDITVFREVATETTILWEDLEFLLEFLRGSVDFCHGIKLKRYITSVASEVVEDFRNLLISSSVDIMILGYIRRLEVFFGDPSQSPGKKYSIVELISCGASSIDQVMKNSCVSKFGIKYILLRVLRKIHFIRERIELIKA